MKKYLKTLPLILFPYAYLIFLICVYSIQTFVKEGQTIDADIIIKLGIVAIVLYNLWVLILSLWSAIGGMKRYTPTEAAKMNLAVKCWHIPAYITHFLIGVLGVGSTLISVNASGVGLITFAVVIDLVTIFLSGLHAAGCVWRLKKEGVLSSETALLAGIGSFIYCVDVIAAIALVQLCGKKFPPEESKHFRGTERSVRIRKTLAYLCALLMALYPYAPYALIFSLSGIDSSVSSFVAVVYALLILFIAIRSAYDAFSLHSPLAAAGMNLAVKGIQIPAYLLNFFSGALLGALLSVWGLIPIVFFVIIDLITITLSGIYAIGCIRRLEKEGVLSSGKAILAGIGSFIYCVDIIVAIVLVCVCCKKRPKTGQNKTIASPQQTTAAMLPSPQMSSPDQNEVKSETASPIAANVPQREQQTAAENPLPSPPSPVPPAPTPAPNETKGETASPIAANVPQRKKRKKASEMPLPPPLPPMPQKPAPAQNEAAREG